MFSLSVCIITKNEGKVIGNILACATKFADQIVVVDTGSNDNTKAIAKKFAANIYDFEWQNDFSKARNFSFSKANCDYVMWLDCDDFIADDDIQKLLSLKQTLGNADVYMLKYATAFDDKDNPTFVYYRERIFRRSLDLQWLDPVHEVIQPQGKIVYSDILVRHHKVATHYSRRNLNIYLDFLAKGNVFSARQKFYFANELFNNNLLDMAKNAYNDFLRSDGMIENKIQACVYLSRIFAMQNNIDSAIKTLLYALSYGYPSAELCVALGNCFLQKQDYKYASLWYLQAVRPLPDTTLAFVDTDCYGYIPFVQLSLCAYYLGDIKSAIDYTVKALDTKPLDKIATDNLNFFIRLDRDRTT